MRALLITAICLVAATVSAQEPFASAQLQAGAAPALPAMAVGGGQVLLEVSVGSDGRVTDIKPLRMTPSFTETLTAVVRDWRFRPAENSGSAGGRGPVASKVLVAGLFRPPALTLPTLGEPLREGAPASDDTAFPLTTSLPAFPPQANRSGVVVLEARVDRGGRATDLKVVHSAPPFDESARQAVANWIFRPARLNGADTSTLVYVVLGFAAPVTNGFLPVAGTVQ